MDAAGVDDVGTRLVAALAARDTGGLLSLFATDVVFRGMTPGRFWEASSPEEVVHGVLHQWFEPTDVVEAVESVHPGHAGARSRIDYRMRVRNPDGVFLVEQRAYYDLDAAGLVERMNAVCAGFQPVADD